MVKFHTYIFYNIFVSIFPLRNYITFRTLPQNYTIVLIKNKIIMITWSTFQSVLIIFQVPHVELLERNVNFVNLSKAFTIRNLMIINNLSVLMERATLSFKTTLSPQIISMHNLTILFLYDQR